MSLISTTLRLRPRSRRTRALGAPRAIARLGALGLATLASIPASASDGVLEINQTCAIQTGCFAGDTPGLPVTINGSAGRSYRLTSDLVVASAATNGIEISADDVGIDLNNFAIRGPVVCSGTPLACTPSGAGAGVGVTSSTISGTSVRNGSVRGMGSFGVSLGVQAEVTGVRARGNGLFGLEARDGSVLTGNVAYQNGSIGIEAGSGSVVSGNSAYQNGGDGIQVSLGATVSGNTASRNGNDGINVGSGATVSGNTSYDNAGFGIRTVSGATVIGNTVRLNTGFGLVLGAWTGYRENVISSNTGGTVSGASAVNLGDNVCNGLTVCP
jgi:hypothetical protein